MAKIRTLQILRGTTVQNNAYTGSAGELTMDTTTNELRLHDGSTAGGHVIGSGGGGSGYHPDLFDVKWADHICNDVQWLRADAFSWQSGAVYQVAYQHLEDDIDGKTLQSETVGSTTIQFYLADDGHKICPASEESNVSAIYNATGVAWYYIIDTVNERFKLPRTQFAFTGIRNGVGGFVDAGLPNITSDAVIQTWNNNATTAWTSGAISAEAGNGIGLGGANSYTHTRPGWLDASNSNSIYGNSDTVQPKATEMYLYFYVGNFTQTALENTAGITTEEMNNKVNIGHEVIEFQAPTSANNYTWYRKYRDGWVEQGGIVSSTPANITFPVEMADANYYTNACSTSSSSNYSSAVGSRTTTGAQIIFYNETRPACWEVKGMAA